MTSALATKPTHEMSILDESGDTKIIWSEGNADEVDNAKATFDRLRKKGYVAYSVNRKGEQGVVVTEFDPALEKLILAPQMKGG